MTDNHTSGCGLYEPQEHWWQDLQRGSLYIATHALALVISEKIAFVFFSDCNAKVANELMGPFLAPGACFALFTLSST